jgi:hypothetical protein
VLHHHWCSEQALLQVHAPVWDALKVALTAALLLQAVLLLLTLCQLQKRSETTSRQQICWHLLVLLWNLHGSCQPLHQQGTHAEQPQEGDARSIQYDELDSGPQGLLQLKWARIRCSPQAV